MKGIKWFVTVAVTAVVAMAIARRIPGLKEFV